MAPKFVIDGDVSGAIQAMDSLESRAKRLRQDSASAAKEFSQTDALRTRMQASSNAVKGEYFNKSAAGSAAVLELAAKKREQEAILREEQYFAQKRQKSAADSATVFIAEEKRVTAAVVMENKKRQESAAWQHKLDQVQLRSKPGGMFASPNSAAAVAFSATTLERQSRLAQMEQAMAAGGGYVQASGKAQKAGGTGYRTNLANQYRTDNGERLVERVLAGDPRGVRRILIGAMGTMMGAALGGGGLAAGFAAHEVKKSMEWGHEVELGAAHLGTTTGGYQKLRYMGKLAGMEPTDFETAYKKMAADIEAKPHAFDKLGISAEAFKGMDSSSAILKAVEALQKMKGPEQTYATNQIFGKKGLALLGLDMGSAEDANKNVISEEDVKTLAKAQEAWEKFMLAIEHGRNTITAKTLDILGTAAEYYTNKPTQTVSAEDALALRYGMKPGVNSKNRADGTAQSVAAGEAAIRAEADKKAADANAKQDRLKALDKKDEFLKTLRTPKQELDDDLKRIEGMKKATAEQMAVDWKESIKNGGSVKPEDQKEYGDTMTRLTIAAQHAQQDYADSIRLTISPLQEFQQAMEKVRRATEDGTHSAEEKAKAEDELRNAYRDKLGMTNLTEKYQKDVKDIDEYSKSGGGTSGNAMADYAGPASDSGENDFSGVLGHNRATENTALLRSWRGKDAMRGTGKGWGDYRPATPAGYGMFDDTDQFAPAETDEQKYAKGKKRSEIKRAMGIESPDDDYAAKKYEMDKAREGGVISQDEYNYGDMKNSAERDQSKRRIWESTPQGEMEKLYGESQKTLGNRIQSIQNGAMVDDMFSPSRRSGGTFGHTDDATGAVAMGQSKGQANAQERAAKTLESILKAILDANSNMSGQATYNLARG